MAIKITNANGMPSALPTATASPRKRRTGSAKRRPVQFSLQGAGWLRVGHMLTLLDCSSPTLYARIKRGQVPPPDGHSGVHPYWLKQTVAQYLATLNRAS